MLYKNRHAILVHLRQVEEQEAEEPAETRLKRAKTGSEAHLWETNRITILALERGENPLDSISFLFEDYKMNYATLFAEVIDVYRRMLLSGCVVFMGATAETRSLWGIVCAGAWLLIFDSYRPFSSEANNTLAHLCNFSVLSTFVLAYMMIDHPALAERYLGWVVFFLHMFMFSCVVFQQAVLYRNFIAKEDGARPSKPADDDMEFPQDVRRHSHFSIQAKDTKGWRVTGDGVSPMSDDTGL